MPGSFLCICIVHFSLNTRFVSALEGMPVSRVLCKAVLTSLVGMSSFYFVSFCHPWMLEEHQHELEAYARCAPPPAQARLPPF